MKYLLRQLKLVQFSVCLVLCVFYGCLIALIATIPNDPRSNGETIGSMLISVVIDLVLFDSISFAVAKVMSAKKQANSKVMYFLEMRGYYDRYAEVKQDEEGGEE